MSFTITTIAAGWAVLSLAGYGGSEFISTEALVPIAFATAGTFTTSAALALLALCGRRQPVGDGVVAINLLVIGFGLVLLLGQALSGPSPYPDGLPGLYLLLLAGASLIIFVPAYLVAYLALCRTPLLRALRRRPKAKGPPRRALHDR